MTSMSTMPAAFSPGNYEFILSVCLAGLVAALTVGGKAVGKGIAMMHSNSIIFMVGKLVSFVAPVKRGGKKK